MNKEQLDELLKKLVEKDSQVCNMAPCDITTYVSELHYLSDKLSDYMREVDADIAKAKQQVIEELMARDEKISASVINSLCKVKEAEYKADKDWADRALKLLSSMRIAALSARKAID